MRDRTTSVRHLGTLLAAFLMLGACALAIALWSSPRSKEADALSRDPSEDAVEAPTALPVVARQAQESTETIPAVESSPAKSEPEARAGTPAAARDGSATLSGVVRTESGEVLRATVRARAFLTELSAACDAEGGYELVLPSRQSVVVTVLEPGFVLERFEFEPLDPGSRVSVDVVLRRAYQVRGRVTDEQGAPIAGARLLSSAGTDEHLSDSEGRYRLDHLDPRSPASIRVHHRDFAAAIVEVPPRGMPVIEQDIVLRRGRLVRGVVIEENGAPIAKAAVRLGTLRTVSGADGGFELSAVSDGRHSFKVQKKGFAPHSAQLELAAGRDAEPLRVVLQRAHFVGGIVRDESGAPLARIMVEAAAADGSVSSSSLTKKDGRFRLDGLPAANVVLSFSGAGYQALRETPTSLDHETLEIVLRRTGRLAGRVIDANTGQGLSDFTVQLEGAMLQPGERAVEVEYEWRRGRRFLGKDGSWDSGTTTLEVGALCDLVIRAPGKAVMRISRVAVTSEARPEDCVARLQSGGVVRGRVVYSDGLPVVGIEVNGTVQPGAEILRFEHYIRQVTDEDGGFRFECIPAGPMTLRISGVEGRTLQDGPFQVENGVEVERTLVLDRGHRLKGLVLDAAGRPVADALVKARSSERGGPSFAAERRTSARGEFLFEGVPLGTVELEHFAREGVHRFVHCKIEIVVRAGENAVNLRPPQGGCSIRGTVRAEVELPDALTLSVSVPWSEREKTTFRQRDVLVQNGVFELGGLEPGTYSVHVAAQISGARWSVVLRVRLAADESRAVELVLRENRIR